MKWSAKPVIILGHGVRASGADPRPLLELGVPILSSWMGADLVDNRDPMYFGRTGIYGQRAANRILYEADQILAIGCRLCPWTIGHGGLRKDQQLVMVDVDGNEAAKFKQAQWINEDAAIFCTRLIGERRSADDGFVRPVECKDWLEQCGVWRERYPWVESPAHDDTPGYINSYRFVERLEPLLRPDEVIVCDDGSLLCPVFQALHVKPPQRIITSGCLGEMGCALPAAVGASFARGKGDVLAFIGDGGMMMNLQELATIRHHWLPIKMLVFENDGYSMIKGTYANQNLPRKGVSKTTGLSFPDFFKIAQGFDIPRGDLRTWNDFDLVKVMLKAKSPFLLQVHIDPEQLFVPRLQPVKGADGKITPARFDQLSPILA